MKNVTGELEQKNQYIEKCDKCELCETTSRFLAFWYKHLLTCLVPYD